MIRRSSFGVKVLSVSLLTTLVALIVSGVGFFVYDTRNFKGSIEARLKSEARILGSVFRAALDFNILDQGDSETLRLALEKHASIDWAAIYDKDQELVLHYTNGSNIPIQGPPPDGVAVDDDGMRVTESIFPSDNSERVGTIVIYGNFRELSDRIDRYLTVLLIVAALATVLAMLLSFQLQRTMLRPIKELVSTTSRIAHQRDYGMRAKKLSQDELGDLTDRFNDMLAQIQRRDQALQQSESRERRLNESLESKNKELETIIYVTSHDLRAPLVNIQGFGRELSSACHELITLLDPIEHPPRIDQLIEAEIPESLSYITSSSSKMSQLLSGLLRISRLDRAVLNIQELDMNEMIDEVLRSFEYRIQQKKIRVERSTLPPCFGDPLQINQVFSNLIDNAIKYGSKEPQSVIRIRGHVVDESTIYEVSDNGQGIAPDLSRHVFEIFHRGQGNEERGDGIGLTIVQRVVNRHHGHVWLESERGEGTTFRIQLSRVRRDNWDAIQPPMDTDSLVKEST